MANLIENYDGDIFKLKNDILQEKEWVIKKIEST